MSDSGSLVSKGSSWTLQCICMLSLPKERFHGGRESLIVKMTKNHHILSPNCVHSRSPVGTLHTEHIIFVSVLVSELIAVSADGGRKPVR